ncbi:uncharacterized protein LOC125236497 [Leguminivora glycinivorella]|uniref:uncharacterized protein LOC125236497 n=1 Tax=Leguminivora glycinivorella TaxID=1035111 RepID=UPI00200C0A65|nr:uncharacterized protein LOC125236497 [Leguminivora glycinivorella]
MSVTLISNNILQFNTNTLEDVRKEFNLHDPGMMEQTIDILYDWCQKQDHFVKKDFPRDYLERFIIYAKGSLEKAKLRIDRLCTMRTMAPNLFEKSNAKNDFPDLRDFYINVFMPKLTEDNYRIHVAKMMTKNITPSGFLKTYQHAAIMCEYITVYDYAQGFYSIMDLSDVNMADVLTNMNLADFRNNINLFTECYGFRIAGIFIISTSKMIDAFVKILKQIVSDKIAQRINVFKTVTSLHEFLPKELLPEDFGGDQKSLCELYDEMNEEMSTEKHVAHMKEMQLTCTNENLRQSGRFDEEYLGMPGSFKLLSVD